MSFIRMIFAWWHHATFGTLATIWFSGTYVGTDKFGNRYYQNKNGSRRWVVYNGTVEASRVPPDWHGWLHHTNDIVPPQGGLPRKAWQKDHLPNLSGTDLAYRPPGSTLVTGGDKPKPAYEAWRPS